MRGRTVAILLMVIAPTLRCGSGFREGGVPIDGGSSGKGGGESGKGGSMGMAGSDGEGGSGGEGGSNGTASGGERQAGGGGDGGAAASSTTPSGGAGGEAGESSAQAGAAGSPPIDTSVRGKVMHEFGGPLPGWEVVIGSTKVTTNDAGEFTIADVGDTYDLVVAASDEHLRIYEGLTTRTPIAVMSWMEGDPGWVEHSFSASGEVTNRLVQGSGVLDVWISERRVWTYVLGAGPLLPAPSPFGSLEVPWNYDQNPITVELFAVQTDGTTWRTGSYELSASAGSAYSGLSIALEAVASRAVTTTTELAPGVSLTNVLKCLSDYCGSTLPLGLSSRNARVQATGTHLSGTTKTIVRPADHENELTLALTAPPGLFSPANNASGVSPGTTFSWQPYADGIHVLQISATGYLVEVYTTQTSFALSSVAGATYATGTHTWKVLGVGPATSVDESVSQPAPLPLKSVEYLTESTARTFTPQ